MNTNVFSFIQEQNFVKSIQWFAQTKGSKLGFKILKITDFHEN